MKARNAEFGDFLIMPTSLDQIFLFFVRIVKDDGVHGIDIIITGKKIDSKFGFLTSAVLESYRKAKMSGLSAYGRKLLPLLFER
jgi:hypothetical protein